MTTYENSYLGVSLKVPDDWLLTTWRDSTIAPAWRKAYQLGDDDVPRDGDPAASKFLFTAVRHLPGSDIRVLADIELSVCLLPQTLGLRDQLLANFRRQQAHYADSGIISTITGEGTWMLGHCHFAYVDQVSTRRRATSRYRFFFARCRDGLGLYGKIAGHTEPAYDDALLIVQGLTCDEAG